MKLYKSYTIKLETGCGTLYLTEATDVNSYKIIKLQLGKAGGCVTAHLSVLSELLTVAINTKDIKPIAACCGIKCPSAPCCIDAAARHMLDRITLKGGDYK